MYRCIAGGCGGGGGIWKWWVYNIVYFLSPLGVEIAAFGDS